MLNCVFACSDLQSNRFFSGIRRSGNFSPDNCYGKSYRQTYVRILDSGKRRRLVGPNKTRLPMAIPIAQAANQAGRPKSPLALQIENQGTLLLASAENRRESLSVVASAFLFCALITFVFARGFTFSPGSWQSRSRLRLLHTSPARRNPWPDRKTLWDLSGRVE